MSLILLPQTVDYNEDENKANNHLVTDDDSQLADKDEKEEAKGKVILKEMVKGLTFYTEFIVL